MFQHFKESSKFFSSTKIYELLIKSDKTGLVALDLIYYSRK